MEPTETPFRHEIPDLPEWSYANVLLQIWGSRINEAIPVLHEYAKGPWAPLLKAWGLVDPTGQRTPSLEHEWANHQMLTRPIPVLRFGKRGYVLTDEKITLCDDDGKSSFPRFAAVLRHILVSAVLLGPDTRGSPCPVLESYHPHQDGYSTTTKGRVWPRNVFIVEIEARVYWIKNDTSDRVHYIYNEDLRRFKPRNF